MPIQKALASIWTGITNMFRVGAALGRPLSSGTNVFTVSTPEVYAPISSRNAIECGFNENTAVYSIVMKDADKIASIPRYVYDAAKHEAKAKKFKRLGFKLEHKASQSEYYDKAPALTALLDRPNKNEGRLEFFTKERAYYKVCGESMIWLNRGDLEDYRNSDGTFDDMAIDRLPVLEMQILPPNLMTIIPDPRDLWGVLGYVLEVGERIVVRAGDVIHCKMTNLSFDAATRSHLRGMSPLTPGAKTLGENNAMALASMRQAQNDGAKFVLFNETFNNLSPVQQSELKRVIDKKINNNDVAGAVATLQGKWGGIDLGKSSHDMELLEAKRMSWQELCFLLKVPYEFFDAETTYANKQQAQVGWITNDILPAAKKLDGELNRVLLKAFNLEGKAIICTDASDLPEMITAMVDAAVKMQELWCISPNDVREFLGYESYEDERFDQPWVPIGRTPLDDVMDPEAQAIIDNMGKLNDDEPGSNTGGSNGKIPASNGRAALQNA